VADPSPVRGKPQEILPKQGSINLETTTPRSKIIDNPRQRFGLESPDQKDPSQGNPPRDQTPEPYGQKNIPQPYATVRKIDSTPQKKEPADRETEKSLISKTPLPDYSKKPVVLPSKKPTKVLAEALTTKNIDVPIKRGSGLGIGLVVGNLGYKPQKPNSQIIGGSNLGLYKNIMSQVKKSGPMTPVRKK
jgi:hypothetical protein